MLLYKKPLPKQFTQCCMRKTCFTGRKLLIKALKILILAYHVNHTVCDLLQLESSICEETDPQMMKLVSVWRAPEDAYIGNCDEPFGLVTCKLLAVVLM